ncbi:MAG: hypothetical protein ABI443_07725 [Chthoniobacterales bacterium]
MNADIVPAAFCARFSQHNRNAILTAILTGIFAILGWVLVYGLLYWGTLFISTSAKGTETHVATWITPAFLILTTLLLLLAALDHAFFRFAPLDDRPIVGIHLIKEFALLLPKLTFSAFGTLLAYQSLSKDDLHRAWEILIRIHHDRKSDFFTLSQVEPDARRLNALLLALQLTGFIDLHQGRESWFYLVRTDELPAVNKMLADGATEETN